jgi:hypothetical protein
MTVDFELALFNAGSISINFWQDSIVNCRGFINIDVDLRVTYSILISINSWPNFSVQSPGFYRCRYRVEYFDIEKPDSYGFLGGRVGLATSPLTMESSMILPRTFLDVL